MSAYYLKQVVKQWSIGDIYKGMYQFMVLQVICVGVIIYYPSIVTWLPTVLEACHARAEDPEEHQRSSTAEKEHQVARGRRLGIDQEEIACPARLPRGCVSGDDGGL
jgi:hypothetical protein